MEAIKIKRATTNGLKDAEGILIEKNGYQFCFVKDEGLFFMVELTTGCSVKTIDADIWTRKQALKIAKEEINKRSKAEFEKAMNHVKDVYCRKYNFKLPVNEAV